jgi:hypothetical protein
MKTLLNSGGEHFAKSEIDEINRLHTDQNL